MEPNHARILAELQREPVFDLQLSHYICDRLMYLKGSMTLREWVESDPRLKPGAIGGRDVPRIVVRSFPVEKIKPGKSFFVPGPPEDKAWIRSECEPAALRLGFKIKVTREKQGGVQGHRVHRLYKNRTGIL